jgi:cation diffusion facilitator family transporter
MHASSWSRAQTVAAAALVTTVALLVTKLVVWSATGSLAVLSQALDSIVDLVALGLVFVGVRIAGKPADDTHHYGHGKAENLVAFTQTLLLGVVVLGIVAESARRLAGESDAVEAPWLAIVLMAASVVVDVIRIAVMRRTARTERSEALAAGALNIAGDVGTALVALTSLLLVALGAPDADPIGALVVAAGVLVAAVRLGKRSVDVLMDRAPAAPVEAIAAATTSAAGVAETRRVRVRGAGDRLFADVTVAAGRTDSLERAHDIAERVEREIERVAPGTDVVVHVEPAARHGDVVERVQAAASRTEGVHEVHNVSVHSLPSSPGDHEPARLHVTLHAKTRPGVSIGEAHDLSDAIEASVARELGERVRVDTHIEPLEGAAPGRDVTRTRRDIVAAVQRLALEQADILDCHEVVVTASPAGVSVVAHVRGRSDLPLQRIHEASIALEQAIHRAHPEVVAVLTHFEPADTPSAPA